MYKSVRVNVKVERGSTFTSTCSIHCLYSIYARIRVCEHKNYATVEIHFKQTLIREAATVLSAVCASRFKFDLEDKELLLRQPQHFTTCHLIIFRQLK